MKYNTGEIHSGGCDGPVIVCGKGQVPGFLNFQPRGTLNLEEPRECLLKKLKSTAIFTNKWRQQDKSIH